MTDVSEQSVAEVLKPCPFCGGKATVIGIRDGRQVSCIGQPRVPCFAKGPAVYHGPGGWAQCEIDVIAAWNTRTHAAALLAAPRAGEEK